MPLRVRKSNKLIISFVNSLFLYGEKLSIMKKWLLLTTLVFGLQFLLQAQQECATETEHEFLIRNDADYARNVELHPGTGRLITDTGQVFIVPIVVHVVHLGENEGTGSNISTGTIVGAINKMNQNFRNSNGMDIGIQFCLAKVDPNGQPTNGITRTDGRVVPGYQSEGIGSSSSNSGLDVIEIKNLIQWPTDQYYNIHVVHKVVDASAFAYYPQSVPFFRDGTTIEDLYMGNLFNTLSHELGHAFNLRHTFNGDGSGNTCPANNNCETDGDFICDTSPHKRGDCFFGNTCVSGSDPTWQNTRLNHMSYCGLTNRFTAMQIDRMRLAALFSGSRTVLWENESVCSPLPAIDGDILGIDYPQDGSIHPMCGTEIVAEFTLANRGTTPINQFSVDYTFDDFSSSATFSTNLHFGESATFTLPPYLIDANQAVNELWIEIANVNESADENNLNDSEYVAFGVYDTCVTTGLANLLASTLQIYPSPNGTEWVYIDGIPENIKLSLTVADVSGRILMQENNLQNRNSINIQSLAKGCYFFIFRNENELFSKSFIRL
jgi:hypothetical protein